MTSTSLRFWAGIAALFTLNLVLWLSVWVVGGTLVFGLHATAVPTGSMRPSIEPGDLVLLRSTSGENLAPGAIIRFRPNDSRTSLLHRIEDIAPDGRYITRGDANSTADQVLVSPRQVSGVGVLLVPTVGYWFLARSEHPTLTIGVTAVLIALMLFAARNALNPDNDPWAHAFSVPRPVAAQISTRPVHTLDRPDLVAPQLLRHFRAEVAAAQLSVAMSVGHPERGGG